MVVNSGKNIIYEDQDESNSGDDKNYIQTRGPKEAQFCFKQWRNEKHIKYQISCPEKLLQIFEYEYSAKRTNRTWCDESSEEIEHAASDVGMFTAHCTSKCGDELRVKYIVTKAVCKYFGMNIPPNTREPSAP